MNEIRITLWACVLSAVLGGVAQAQPANNNFTNAWILAGTAAATNGNTSQPSNATKETGEPNHAGLVGGRSVWFNWTAPVSLPARITTAGSPLNTLLAVYTGEAVNALTLVAANDNFAGLGNASRVDFNAQAGTTYRIAVDGRNFSGNGAASGSYTLTVLMPGSVTILSPGSGGIHSAGTPIPITVQVATPNPPVARVDFYRSGILFASETAGPFGTTLLDPPVGANSLVAVMTDGAGLSWTSAVVNVVVLNPGLTLTAPAAAQCF